VVIKFSILLIVFIELCNYISNLLVRNWDQPRYLRWTTGSNVSQRIKSAKGFGFNHPSLIMVSPQKRRNYYL